MEFLASLSVCMAVCLLIARALRHRGFLREVGAADPSCRGGLPSVAVIGPARAGALYFQIPLWYGLLFRLAYSVATLIAVDSVRMRVTGRTRWKDLIYS